jgi:flagellar basal body-associated protein FliL
MTMKGLRKVVEMVAKILALGAVFGATMLLSNQHAATAPQPTVTLQEPQHTPQEGVNR